MRRKRALIVGIAAAVVGLSIVRIDSKPSDFSPLVLGKERAPLRVLLLGTSLSSNAAWPADLIREVDERCGIDISITVVAAPGMTSDWGVRALDGIDVQKVDLLVVEFAINDARFVVGVPMDRSRANVSTLLTALGPRPPPASVLLVTNPATGVDRLFRWRLNSYYAAHREVAADSGAVIIDGTDRWSERLNGVRDGIHPDPKVESSIYTPLLVDHLCGRQPSS